MRLQRLYPLLIAMVILVLPISPSSPALVQSAVPAASAVRLTDSGTMDYEPIIVDTVIQPAVLNDRVIFSSIYHDIWVTQGQLGDAVQLVDLSTDTMISDIHAIVSNGAYALIFVNTNQIWRSDGTTAGTALIATLPDSLTFGITNRTWYNQQGDDILFAVQAQSGYQIWRSDGTAAGTVFASDILAPAYDFTHPLMVRTFLMPDGTFLQLVSDSNTNLQELRRITGPTPNDVQILKTWPPGNLLYSDAAFFAHDQLVFTLQNQGQTTLWQSDGTTEGTVELLLINESLGCYWNTDGHAQMVGICSQGHLILSDGTRAGTSIREFFLPSHLRSCYPSRIRADTQLLVSCSVPWGHSGYSTTLLQLNLSTYEYKLLEERSTNYYTPAPILFDTHWLIVTTYALGFFDGTTDHINWSTPSIPSEAVAYRLIGLEDRLLYRVSLSQWIRPLAATEVFGTDGTPDGAELLLTTTFFGGALLGIIRSGERQGSGFLQGNNDLWISDGTRAGTQLLTPNTNIGFAGSTMLGDLLYFVNRTESGIEEIWRSDGTITGTQQVIALQPGFISLISSPPNTLYFKFNDGAHGDQLWATDGTSAGTRRLTDLPGNSQAYRIDNSIVTTDGKLFFSMNDGVHGTELWVTDGSTAGTKLVADLVPGAESSYPDKFVASTTGQLFFTAIDTGISQLWITDGSSGGTHRLTSSTVAEATISAIVATTAGRVYFAASDLTGSEIWISDGTPSGTQRVADLTLGNGGMPPPYSLTPLPDGRMAFVADDGTHGPELWITDGTSGGTQRLSDIAPGEQSPNIQDMTLISDTLFFTADDGTHGRELWWWDGATVQFQDLNPGAAGSDPAEFTRVGNLFYFTAVDTYGREIWGLPVGPAQIYLRGTSIGGPPGETAMLLIGYGNLGYGTGPVTITLTLGGPTEAAALPTYLSDTSGISPTINGNQVQWRNLPADALLRRQIAILLSMPDGAPGTRYTAQIQISGPAGVQIDHPLIDLAIPIAWNHRLGFVARP